MSDTTDTRREVELLAYYDASLPPGLYGDPHIDGLVPATASAAAGAALVTVNGSKFEAASVVEVNQVAQATTFVNPGRLTISYDPTVAGAAAFTVRNPNGEESNTVTFTVTALAADEPASSSSSSSTKRSRSSGK